MDFLIENVNVVKGIHFQPASFFGRYPEGDELEADPDVRAAYVSLSHRPGIQYTDSLPISQDTRSAVFTQQHPGAGWKASNAHSRSSEVKVLLLLMRRTAGDCCARIELIAAATREWRCGEDRADCCERKNRKECCLNRGGGDFDGLLWHDTGDQLEWLKKTETTFWTSGYCRHEAHVVALASLPFASNTRAQWNYRNWWFFSYYKRNHLTVTGCASRFDHLDAERLKRCRVCATYWWFRLIPFFCRTIQLQVGF